MLKIEDILPKPPMHADRSAPIMRFPWQKRKVEQPTDFPLKLNTDNLNWCRDARLLLIEGNGTLKRESRGRNEDWSQQYALTLRGTPLIVHNAPECPTCAGLLATGYGLDKPMHRNCSKSAMSSMHHM